MVTQRDVANLVGVTQRTVSRSFSDPAAVSLEIRARIFATARKLGYRPNRAARIIRGGRSDCVTLLRDAGATAPYIHSRFLWSVHQCLREQRLYLAIEDLPTGSECSDVSDLHLSDGVLVPCHSDLSAQASAYVRNLSVPVVWVNTRVKGDCVCPDDRRAGREATEHLLRLGHRRLTFVDRDSPGAMGRPPYSNGGARLDGYREAMDAAGLPSELIRVNDADTPDATLGAYRHLLTRSKRPTGLVVGRKKDAQAAVFATHSRKDLQVPRDLSIVTFSDDSPWTSPWLTAWVTPWETMGRVAVELLVARLHRSGSKKGLHWVPMEMTKGATCGPPPFSAGSKVDRKTSENLKSKRIG